MSIETIVASGILFAGDLHLSSRAPSRRCDDYASAGLEKVRQLVEIANANQFVLVLLGDVFHSPIERSEALKTRLLRTLGDCWTTVLCNVGNHASATPIPCRSSPSRAGRCAPCGKAARLSRW